MSAGFKSTVKSSGKVEKRFGGVIFLDVLGTKEVLKKKDANQVISEFDRFVKGIESTLDINNRVNSLVYKGSVIPLYEIKAFSDTIIITCSVKFEDKQKVNADYLLEGTASPLPTIFVNGLQKEIFLRGCISFGEFYQSERMTIGAAVYEAAQYYMLPEWAGISAAPSAHYQLTISKDKIYDALKYFVKHDIPVKNGIEKNAWVLNWPSIKHQRTYIKLDMLVDLEEEYRAGLKKAKGIMLEQMNSADIGVAWKWRNTLDFYEKNLAL